MIKELAILYLLFMLYSFLGWSMEVICKLIEKHRFINRGFLIGPYCPIYGCGCIAMILLLYKYLEDPIILFFMAIIICSILEYSTSFIMEKLFKTRWWDYSNKKYNLNGRICLDTMLPFGLLGCLVLYIINPFFSKIINKLPVNIMVTLSLIILITFIIDNIISFKIILGVRTTIKNVEKDATEEITTKVREILMSKSFLYKRLIKAFPNIKNRREYLLDLKEKIENDLQKLKNEKIKRKKQK